MPRVHRIVALRCSAVCARLSFLEDCKVSYANGLSLPRLSIRLSKRMTGASSQPRGPKQTSSLSKTSFGPPFFMESNSRCSRFHSSRMAYLYKRKAQKCHQYCKNRYDSMPSLRIGIVCHREMRAAQRFSSHLLRILHLKLRSIRLQQVKGPRLIAVEAKQKESVFAVDLSRDGHCGERSPACSRASRIS